MLLHKSGCKILTKLSFDCSSIWPFLSQLVLKLLPQVVRAVTVQPLAPHCSHLQDHPQGTSPPPPRAAASFKSKVSTLPKWVLTLLCLNSSSSHWDPVLLSQPSLCHSLVIGPEPPLALMPSSLSHSLYHTQVFLEKDSATPPQSSPWSLIPSLSPDLMPSSQFLQHFLLDALVSCFRFPML